VTAGPVRFTADSAALEGEAVDTVRAVAAVLAVAPEATVVLTGHVADTPGSPEGAQALSLRRAEAVADALVTGGVDRTRITTAGRGAAEPLDTRAASRRVEFEIR
jgi:outer membrane protein OmpA-like peptidoglycan-associated protein